MDVISDWVASLMPESDLPFPRTTIVVVVTPPFAICLRKVVRFHRRPASICSERRPDSGQKSIPFSAAALGGHGLRPLIQPIGHPIHILATAEPCGFGVYERETFLSVENIHS